MNGQTQAETPIINTSQGVADDERYASEGRKVVSAGQITRYIVFLLLLLVFASWDYKYFFIVVNFCICTFYICVMVYKLMVVGFSFIRNPSISVTPEEIAQLRDEDLPTYTILCPMYKEKEVAGAIVKHMEALDYPKEKLDIKLLLEEDDNETAAVLATVDLPGYFEICIVKDNGQPKTKPRACNIGLDRARGEFTVIFDAEDRPEPDQLKKAVIAFSRASENMVCLQSRLMYFNRHQNMLTKMFSIEYAAWFELYLPGLHDFDLPIPLGGTSNHFRTTILRKVGAWDPYNVTEDCDLGIRLHRAGYRTQTLDTITWEEANSRAGNWIRQRSRWVKGYMQSYLVHFRHPIRLLRDLGLKDFISVWLSVGGFTFMLLLNPIYWALAVAYILIRWQVYYPGDTVSLVFCWISGALVLTNIFFVLINYMAVYRCKMKGMTLALLLTPFYWALISVAAWKGFLQLFTNPFFWEKTLHGLDNSDQ